MNCIFEATRIVLTKAERAELDRLVRSTKTEHRRRLRARIVLLAADGLATREIGRRVGCTTGTASKWRVRYAENRLAGLDETGNRGNAPKYGMDATRRILRVLDLAARRSWCESNDPEFAAKAAEVVGLYMAPPENAIVISVDEKPSIQALERRQGYLKTPDGRSLMGQSHNYTRHGTTTLFAALNIATGQVTGRQYKRRRRVEFLDFMNQIVAEHPGREIHVILDNLNTHKPKDDRWLKRHPNVHFHFTPTKASWLNQIEIWFSILSAKALTGTSFNSRKELMAHIDAFIKAYNVDAKPFAWTKSEVHQKRMKPGFADQ